MIRGSTVTAEVGRTQEGIATASWRDTMAKPSLSITIRQMKIAKLLAAYHLMPYLIIFKTALILISSFPSPLLQQLIDSSDCFYLPVDQRTQC
jgi:hypothetical protein